jgi:hypothetical protein
MLTVADLTTVTTLLDRGAPAAVADALDLLRACLAHRFDTEVGLGTGATGSATTATEHDIALGGSA